MNGGFIKRGNAVTRIHMGAENVEYVELEDGEKIFAKHFISNIHPAQTLEMLDTDKIRPVYKSRIKSLENSVSAFVLYLVLKPDRRIYSNRNYYYFDNDDVWKGTDPTYNAWPFTYGLFECVPKHQSKYLEALSVISYMRFEDVKQWEDTYNRVLVESDRGKDYEEFKQERSEKLLDLVEQKFPGMREDIQSCYTATPLSFRDYIGTGDGNMYGIVKNFNDPVVTRISPKTKISNLLFTGQNVNLHGVLGVTISAVLTCSSLVGKEYLVNKIIKANEEVV